MARDWRAIWPAAGVEVIEVDRPNRQARRAHGKSDPADAVEAARAAQSGRAAGVAKSRDGNVEAIRALVVAKRSARDTRIKTLNQIRHLSFTRPRAAATVRGLSRDELAREAAPRCDRGPAATSCMMRTKVAMRTSGPPRLALDDEMVRLDAVLPRS